MIEKNSKEYLNSAYGQFLHEFGLPENAKAVYTHDRNSEHIWVEGNELGFWEYKNAKIRDVTDVEELIINKFSELNGLL